MAEIINGVPIGDLPGIESVPDDSMLVVEFLGKAYHMPGAVLRQMIQDVLDSMGDSVDDVTEARLTAAIETVLASGKYNGVSPSVEVLDEEDGTTVIHIIDAFGDKRYPVEVKGATDAVRYKPQSLTDAQKKQARENIDVSPGTITVKLSGSVTGGFDVVLNGESVTNEPLDRLAEEGYRVVGVAISEVKVLNYKVPAGTLFEYTNVFEFEDNSVVGSQDTRRFVFRVQVDDCNFTLRCTDGVWGGILQPIQATFFLKRNNGGPFIQYNGKTILPEDANWLSVQLILCEVQHRPVFCFQGDMQFFTDNNTAIQPPWGTAFSLRINDDNDYYFATEYDGYELQLLISPDGFVNSARKTSVYKAVESKADDLKAEDGTLFLLSAGEPIGAGVPLPAGSATDSKIFIADLNTSTYEDIKAADDAGKICYALWGGYTACMLTTLSPESAIFTTLLDPHLGLYVKFTKGTVGVSDFGLTESHSVLYEPQSLTDAQKAQARENIGALSTDDIEQVLQDVGAGNVYVSGLFSAKYADIKAAYEAGKACFVTYGALLCTMTVFDAEKAEFVGMLTPHIGMKGILYADGTYNFQYVHSNAVQTVDQSLTDDQKAQARTNIGALSTADVDTVLQQAKDSGQFDGKDGYTPVKGKDYFDGYTPVKGKDYFDGANGKTAYAYAQDGGYTGTEAEFAAKLASDSEPLVVTLSGNDTDGYTADKTVAEIYAARTAGRDVYMVGGVVTYQLSYLNGSFAAFSYTMASRNAIEIISVIMMSGVAPTRIHQTIDDSYVKCTAQSLDEDYKLQARSNIGALGTGGGTLSGGLDFSNNASWVTPYLLAFKNADPNQNPTYPYIGFYQWGPEWQVNARDANNNWAKNLLTINNETGVANFAAVPTVNGAQLALSSDLSSYLPLGGGTLMGALNLKNSTWNLAGDDAYFGDNDTAGSFAIKGANGTTNLKMVTYNGTTSGTLSWDGSMFIFSNPLNVSGRLYSNEWIQCNGEGGLFFPNHYGMHIMANTVSTYTPLRIVGEKASYNGVLFGNDSTGLNVMSHIDHQGLYNESQGRWITYYNRATDKIGIGTSELSDEFLTIGGSASVSGRIIASGGAYISGRCQGGGDDEGIVIGRASNDYAGLTLGGATGVHATLYLLPDNSTVWRYHNGSAAYDIKHPGKAGTIALTSDVEEAAAPLRVNYNTTSQTVDKTLSEIKAAWDAGRSVVLTDGTSVYPLNYVDTSEAVFSSFAINANSKFFFDSVHINSSGKVRYYSYSN